MFADNDYVLVLFLKKITFPQKKKDNPSEIVILVEEELDVIDIDGTGNLQDFPRLVLNNEEFG